MAVGGGLLGSYLFYTISDRNAKEKSIQNQQLEVSLKSAETTIIPAENPSKASFKKDATELPDFVKASAISTESVVFIQTTNEVEYRNGTWMDWFFEPRASQQISTGSGVIFMKGGYIVTNNHVIDDADQIKVIFDRKTLDADLIGADPSTDIAVIKVTENLPAIPLGNSDDVNVGEWVLAVGNPFNLASTVTAGIVSAKGRSINILKDKFPIESFIQTDAAINPGNSGGALVNTAGELIGINTAILSKTGSYSGYGFAVPINIVKKVTEDIINYGEVQKVFLGATFATIDSKLADKLDLASLDGVIITQVQKDWPVDQAKLRPGDVITKINGTPIHMKSELEELLAYMYPGDKVDIVFNRDNEPKKAQLKLTNKEGTTEILKRRVYTSSSLGVSFESIPKVEKDLLGIKNGIRVVQIENGFFSQLDIPVGFIITDINGNSVDTPKELAEILEKIRGKVIIYGVDKRGRKRYYPYIF